MCTTSVVIRPVADHYQDSGVTVRPYGRDGAGSPLANNVFLPASGSWRGEAVEVGANGS
jgi:hypothetical protein